MMEIAVLSIGKVSFPWIQEGIEIFENRLKRYIKFSSITLPDIKGSKSFDIEKIKEEEGKNILNTLQPSDLVILMDEKGKEYASIGLADWMQRQMNTGKKRMVWIIGGPFGFSKNLYDRADFMVALSKMTFTHEMAKLLLSEQLYRAFTILRGEPYHHN